MGNACDSLPTEGFLQRSHGEFASPEGMYTSGQWELTQPRLESSIYSKSRSSQD